MRHWPRRGRELAAVPNGLTFEAGRVSLFYDSLPTSTPASLYVAGPFAMGYTEFYNFLIPIYGLSLGMGAGQIGMPLTVA
jgi:hypothetical protein